MESNTILQQLQWLQSADPSLTYKSLHSKNQPADFDHPHSCSHCQHLSTNVENFVEKPLVDLGEGRASRETEFTLEIGQGLQQAIAASKEGCALFEWFLDTLVYNRHGIAPSVESLDQIVFRLKFDTEDGISCAPVIDGLFPRWRGLKTQDIPAYSDIFTSLEWARLDICVRKDDPASNVISQHPPEYDMFSERSIELGRDCLTTCLKHHAQCRTDWLRTDLNRYDQGRYERVHLPDETIALADLPTRLLCIEDTTNDRLRVRLVEVSRLPIKRQEQVATAGFATLSYCWGREGNPIQLTSETCTILKQGIPASNLPATIYDAVRFSKRLQLEYIWVDALCIFQDDTHDKEIEISRMGAYYGANTVTLCAASASGSSKGLRHPDLSSLYRVPPLSLKCQVGESVGQIILHSKLDIRGCITARGWTLQESLLSHRMIIFSHQLYWCCATANAECEGTLANLSEAPNRRLGLPPSLVPGIFPAQVLRDYPPRTQWSLGVSDFAKRRLGVASDKLLAISAFASWVDARYRARAEVLRTNVTYVAGLFLDTQDTVSLVQQLLWRPSKTSNCTRPLTYWAPSWSWAAVDGEFDLQKESLADGHLFEGFNLEALDLRLAHAAAPYGSVEHATLSLSGCRLQPLQSCLKLRVYVEEKASEPDEEGVYFLPDTPHDGHIILAALDTSTPTSVFLFSLITLRYTYTGLIIASVAGGDSEGFQRLGTFSIYYRPIEPVKPPAWEGNRCGWPV